MDRSDKRVGQLVVVATPIGNPEDISPRAVAALAQADVIACEDTRRAGALLARHDIHKPLISYFEHNERRRAPELIERLKQGANIALISDAGTPTISDPGYRLIREAHQAGCGVTAVPGPSALLAALSIAGLPTDRFTFEGFLPSRSSARRSALLALRGEVRTMVFFESARRVLDTLSAMAESFGEQREVTLARELTKTYEETLNGTLQSLRARLAGQELLGEVTIVVAGSEGSAEVHEESQLTVKLLTDAGLGLRQASEIVARVTGRSRREIYQRALAEAGLRGDADKD